LFGHHRAHDHQRFSFTVTSAPQHTYASLLNYLANSTLSQVELRRHSNRAFGPIRYSSASISLPLGLVGLSLNVCSGQERISGLDIICFRRASAVPKTLLQYPKPNFNRMLICLLSIIFFCCRRSGSNCKLIFWRHRAFVSEQNTLYLLAPSIVWYWNRRFVRIHFYHAAFTTHSAIKWRFCREQWQNSEREHVSQRHNLRIADSLQQTIQLKHQRLSTTEQTNSSQSRRNSQSFL
jgi:hypothetical protein